MNDEQILAKGGTEEDIEKYAEQNGADLARRDFGDNITEQADMEKRYRAGDVAQHFYSEFTSMERLRAGSLYEMESYILEYLCEVAEKWYQFGYSQGQIAQHRIDTDNAPAK